MKRIVLLSALVLLCAGLAGAVAASDQKAVTLEGKVVCAKCSLHEEGLDECQNVLVVEQEGKKSMYYMTKNEVNTKFGDVCKGNRPVRITGTVNEQEGKMWIVASEIKPVEDKG